MIILLEWPLSKKWAAETATYSRNGNIASIGEQDFRHP
jgi:hypothetical protein